MMGYKAQVVASAIGLPIRRKIEKSSRSIVDFVNFRGFKPPHTVVNQGGSWVGFVEGNESFKMVVVMSKNSTGVGRNRPWKMGGRTGLRGVHGLKRKGMRFFALLPNWLIPFSNF
ncbi:S2-RNase [Pyrus ussuriensis x Pyrus communis]|uniref:S2-RNase n=1 Tax=Pyrus ussuriensis x Pyrus communis TaxID=2448454 RepID=A0A5N5FMM1_9ROSA|nr:S2-RNase [Pyrus ussuriensis x Pyrus communis]KAB2636326.1 S2-RNase [Pyrus ussuriensis x Pyrus communis]